MAMLSDLFYRCTVALVVAVLNLSNGSNASYSLNDIPDCVLYNNLCLMLSPISVSNLSLTSKKFHYYSRLSKEARFCKPNGHSFDVELLYDYYIEVGQYDKVERGSLQKLIHHLLPIVEDDPRKARDIENLKLKLFDWDLNVHMRYSDKYTSLSKIILKYCDQVPTSFITDPSIMNDGLFDFFFDGATEIEPWYLNQSFCYHNPKYTSRLFKILKNPSVYLQKALSDGHFLSLVDDGHRIDDETMKYIICRADDDSMELAIKILHDFPRKHIFAPILESWIKNWNKIGIIAFLLENIQLPENFKRELACMIANSERDSLYPALRGRQKVASILDLLKSFNFKTGQFSLTKPLRTSWRQILEVALFYSFPDEVVLRILSQKRLFKDHYLVILAFKMGKSEELVLDLLQCKGRGGFNLGPWLKVQFRVTARILKYILENYKPSDLYVLHLIESCPKSENSLELVKIVMNIKEYQDMLFHSTFRHKLTNDVLEFLLTKAFELKRTFIFDEIVEEKVIEKFMLYLDGFTLSELLERVPNVLVNLFYPADFINSNSYLTIMATLRKDGGYQALKNHFSNPVHFGLAMFFSEATELEFGTLLKEISANPQLWGTMLHRACECNRHLCKLAFSVISKLLLHANDPAIIKTLGVLFYRQHRSPLRYHERFSLEELSSTQLVAMFQVVPNTLFILEIPAMFKKIIKIFVERGIFMPIFHEFVRNFGGLSRDDMIQRFPAIEPYLPEDSEGYAALVKEIQDQQAEDEAFHLSGLF